MTYSSLNISFFGEGRWADFNVRGSFPDALTQLALADVSGPSRALYEHGILTDFLQGGEEDNMSNATNWYYERA